MAPRNSAAADLRIKEGRIVWSGFPSELPPEQPLLFFNRFSTCVINGDIVFYYGAAGDIPVVGDWNGYGKTTIGVFRPAGTTYNKTSQGEWLLRNSNTPGNPDIVFYDPSSDYASIPVVGFWDAVNN